MSKPAVKAAHKSTAISPNLHLRVPEPLLARIERQAVLQRRKRHAVVLLLVEDQLDIIERGLDNAKKN